MGHANVVAILARTIARVPLRVVVSERTTISAEYKRSKGLMAWMSFTLVRLLYSSADGICTVSQEASRDLAHFAKLPLTSIKTIYNPFDLSQIKRKAADHIEHPWMSPAQPPVVLAVGRLNEAKDYPTLIRAFAKLRKQRDVRMVILGEGELRSVLETILIEVGLDKDAVLLPGFVSNPYAWMARCRLFVLSSRWEGLPGVLIEAMACGAPVVSTNCRSGPNEILEGGRWGMLVPVGDVDALASAMARILDTPINELPDVRQRSAHFDQERAVDAYLHILGMPLMPELTTDVITSNNKQV
jgi:glycosyltransferase involved in cell wall biosynthesis